jgi:phage terminase small subunit
MIRKTSIWSLLLLFILIPAALHAQSDEHYQLATELYSAGDFDNALTAAKEALQETEQSAKSNSMALCNPLALLAKIQKTRRDFRGAAQYLERMRSIEEANLGEKDSRVATTVNDLISVYTILGDTAKVNAMSTLASSRWQGSDTETTTSQNTQVHTKPRNTVKHASTEQHTVKTCHDQCKSEYDSCYGTINHFQTPDSSVFRSIDQYNEESSRLASNMASQDRMCEQQKKICERLCGAKPK